MALFFKRIRQKLLINKRFGKYSLYALGEVLIVIVGILVAVQVNSWNEEQKNEAVEISVLKAIKADLIKDTLILKEDMGLHLYSMRSSRIVQDHLANDRPYNDSLARHFIASFYVTNWMHNSGGIQTLKSLGVNTINDEKLRNEIIDLYDVKYNFLQYLTASLTNNFLYLEQNILRPRFEQARLFFDYKESAPFADDKESKKELVKWYERMIPLDYEALKNDHEFLFHLKTYMNEVHWYWFICTDTKNQMSQTILNLEEEIKRLEK
ncbi:MAG: hypothetical protein KJO53_00035 [Eudoraea sp.]|nr:hypothetical protein [Eudoraea sp.]MBT8302142.1 hypothetical protein [Maribacter sp.]